MSTIKEASPVGRSERTRQVLVTATVRRLRADGAFTAEQVASDAGVSVATIYNRFPDGRDGLLVAAFDRVLDMTAYKYTALCRVCARLAQDLPV